MKAKLSGTYQIYSVLFNKYPRPIPTPIHNLRPAQETCEQCHWPAKFWGEQLATRVHYASDEENTRREVEPPDQDGRRRRPGPERGHPLAHEHRQQGLVRRDRRAAPGHSVGARGAQRRKVTEYVSTENPLSPEEIEEGRDAAHGLRGLPQPPQPQIPAAGTGGGPLLRGGTHPDRPALHQEGGGRGDGAARTPPPPRPTRGSSGTSARSTRRNTPTWPRTTRSAAAGHRGGQAGSSTGTSFPRCSVNWQAYPDNIGHKEFPGCFRCHDGKHVSKDGQPSARVHICHDFLQASGRAFSVCRRRRPSPIRGSWEASTRRSSAVAAIRGAREAGHLPRLPQDRRVGSTHGDPGVQRVPPEGPAGPAADELRDVPRGARRPAQGGDPFCSGCTTCHTPHAWAPAPRDTCLTCHADRAQHYPGQACANATPSAPRKPRRPARDHLRGARRSPGPVTFTHGTHLGRGAKCADCHPACSRCKRETPRSRWTPWREARHAGPAITARRPSRSMDGDKCATCHKS